MILKRAGHPRGSSAAAAQPMSAVMTADHPHQHLVGKVAEPFASDEAFWASMAAAVDALAGVLVAAAAAVALRLSGVGAWWLLPFLAAALLAARAGLLSTRSSRANRQHFDDEKSWREAERQAVAAGFGTAVRRRFTRR